MNLRTRGNSRELEGTNLNSFKHLELKGTHLNPKNSREPKKLKGTQKNSRKLKRTQSNLGFFMGSARRSEGRKKTQEKG